MSLRHKYKNRMVFYRKTDSNRGVRPYQAPNNLHKPALGNENRPAFVPDESHDLRERSNLELMESLRSPKERDFYQDHTYHDQWEERKLDDGLVRQMQQRYNYFAPGFQVDPWIWYPGDIVEVTGGPFQGQRGSIIAVVPYKNEVIVQNIHVKDVTIPAGDGRPEQVMQREHPIVCTLTKHVDPSTGQLCDLKLIKVRVKNPENPDAPPQIETRRISLQTGTILPIPEKKAAAGVETGDPLRDTPYQDALETSYEADKEMAVLVERKLAALEASFVKELKRSYTFHEKKKESNAKQMRAFQRDALLTAVNKVTEEMNAAAENLDDWWFEELAPHMEAIQQEEEQLAAIAEQKRQAALDAAQRAAEAAALAAEAAEGDDDGEYEEGAEEEVEEDAADSNDTTSSATSSRTEKQ